MAERRLNQVLTRRFSRLAWTALAGYALVVILVFATAAEMALRRSLEHSADVIQSLLGAYRDSTSAPGGVMPSALADQLVGMGGQVVITRTTTNAGGMPQVYYLSPGMPAKRLEGSGGELVSAITERAGWRDRVLHRVMGEFDIYVVGSRNSYLVPFGILVAAAALLLPLAALASARGRTIGAGHPPHESHRPGGGHRSGGQHQPDARAGRPRAPRAAILHGRRKSRAAHAPDALARPGAVGFGGRPDGGRDPRRPRRDGARTRPHDEARRRAAPHRPRRESPARLGSWPVRSGRRRRRGPRDHGSNGHGQVAGRARRAFTAAGCHRCSRSDPAHPAESRVQRGALHAERQRDIRDHTPWQGSQCECTGHRTRHRTGASGSDLRSVLPNRSVTEPRVGGNRLGPRDRAAAGGTAGRAH